MNNELFFIVCCKAAYIPMEFSAFANLLSTHVIIAVNDAKLLKKPYTYFKLGTIINRQKRVLFLVRNPVGYF